MQESLRSIGILIIVFFLGFNFYQDIELNKQVVSIEEMIDENDKNTDATLESFEYEIDSIHTKIGKLATATVYLDSCQQQKTQKTERAERRGRFVGGLLKGLLPF